MHNDVRDMYREEILEHYRHPMNFGTLKKPSHTISAANPLCGDRITLQLRVEKGIVREVAFEASGCAISIAAASLFSEWMKGKKLAQVQKVGEKKTQELIKAPISVARIQCVLLPYSALKKASNSTSSELTRPRKLG
ncbi:hypothetical protein A3H16_00615 [Candidatus Kaiserbacteria bacterium RIFCSPLOWO2_12_FULL_53_8]|uniref:NIF system FeS cluster assembly NifU N-terminal domain-containing protein n=2 Tax=Candidatus Kaiseribacteriota TaxID=1752734 RepID=A0A1F6CV07_9BACT|nr:MAG: hypothetical protein A2851_02940 [Candidatus Kaiserbacteria bacterium RIFCSPHIGHO2_01_FULL_53_29]OGG91576.1 MAG: hypothetical protein A3H16_00615 [Candidatus Kaiserbacteria bacterium RIFCSPLOWO2_12_FULL_53_8]